jgi:hypothetical protein
MNEKVRNHGDSLGFVQIFLNLQYLITPSLDCFEPMWDQILKIDKKKVPFFIKGLVAYSISKEANAKPDKGAEPVFKMAAILFKTGSTTNRASMQRFE